MSDFDIISPKDVKKHERKKRKLNSINGDNSPSIQPLKKKKKKISKECNLREDNPKFLKYVNNQNFAWITANPKFLPETPEIIKMSQSEKPNTPSSDSFLLDKISTFCFNTDKSARFTNIEAQDSNFESAVEENIQQEISKYKSVSEKKKKKVSCNAIEDGSSASDEDQTQISQVDLYNALDNKSLVFHMQHPSNFSFQGEIKITLIAGQVEIMGYTLHQSSSKKSVNVFSPKFCTPLVVETDTPEESKGNEEIESSLRNILSESNIKTLLDKFEPKDSILLIGQTISTFGIVINKYFEKQLFPKDLEDVSSMSETVKSLQSIFRFTPKKKEKRFRKNPAWANISPGQATVFCGGKGVGKSTLLKYYVNKCMTKGERVLCLDFDIGQPEFTVPGTVSAVIVDEPLLGPNFTHVTDPCFMLYYGDVDVAQNPTKYLNYVSSVIDYCKRNEELSKMRWFVNTMGYCRGLGADLMVTILKLLKPDTVIQIRGFEFKNNFPFFLTAARVNSLLGYRKMPVTDVNLDFDYYKIDSCSRQKKKPSHMDLTPRQLREIMFISYFSRMTVPPFYNFNAIQPYLISFSSLYLGIESFVNPNDVLKAFNGNMVSLSHFDPDPDSEEIFTPETEDDEYFKIVVQPNITPSLGVGFVRGIHCESKKLYVLTHLSSEDLEKVNCLTLGKISPPHSMFLKQDQIEAQPAYTNLSTAAVVQGVKRMFRVPEHLK